MRACVGVCVRQCVKQKQMVLLLLFKFLRCTEMSKGPAFYYAPSSCLREDLINGSLISWHKEWGGGPFEFSSVAAVT